MVKVLSFKLQQWLGSFTKWLVKGPSKQDFLDNYLTTLFGVRNFGNTSAIRVIFVSKCSKFNVDFKNAKKKFRKTFFVPQIIAYELVALNCLY